MRLSKDPHTIDVIDGSNYDKLHLPRYDEPEITIIHMPNCNSEEESHPQHVAYAVNASEKAISGQLTLSWQKLAEKKLRYLFYR